MWTHLESNLPPVPPPAWAMEFDAPVEEENMSAWTHLAEPDVGSYSSNPRSHPMATEELRSPFIASGADDPLATFGVSWKSTFYGPNRIASDDTMAMSDNFMLKNSKSGTSFYPQDAFPDYGRDMYDSNGITDAHEHSNDFASVDNKFGSVDMSPLTLSRQTTNESAPVDSPCYSMMSDEAYSQPEGSISEARSVFERHFQQIENSSSLPSTKNKRGRKRNSVQGRPRRSSIGSVSTPGSRKSSITDKKSLVCPLCNKVFQRDLARHLRTHEATARFICPFPRDQCAHKRGQFNRCYDFKKHLLHYHFTFTDPASARRLRDLNGKLRFQGHCCCGSDHEFDAEEWLDEHITCDPPRCPLLAGRDKEFILREASERAAAERADSHLTNGDLE